MRELDIGEVARRSGLPASTLRFYEEQGLIVSSGRRGLRRLFAVGVLERLALIALARVAGVSLAEIAGMFGPDDRPRIDRRRLAARADELGRTIAQLTALRNGLRHAAACPARTHLECPKFRRLLRAAAAGALSASAPRAAAAAPGARDGSPSPRRPPSAAARPSPPPSSARSRRSPRPGSYR
jgi:DNA-binding transcriptional MerR regulator